MRQIARLVMVSTACTFISGVGPVKAQNYPVRSIHLVVTAPAGGGLDILARQIAQPLSEGLGQRVVVENIGGGSGVIGVERVSQSAPDGYTMMIVGNNFLIFPLLGTKVSYDPIKDFSPITLVSTSPNILVVNPFLPARSVKELIALAKRQPGQLNYATGSRGASTHMAAELFKYMAKVDMVGVPYRGSGPAIIDLISGQVQVMFGTAPSVLPHVKTGRLRGLAISTDKKSQLAPDLPTISESGLPGYESGVSYGLLLPAGTGQSIVHLLNGEIVRYLKLPETKAKMSARGTEAVGSSPKEYAEAMKKEIAKWGEVIKKAKITI